MSLPAIVNVTDPGELSALVDSELDKDDYIRHEETCDGGYTKSPSFLFFITIFGVYLAFVTYLFSSGIQTKETILSFVFSPLALSLYLLYFLLFVLFEGIETSFYVSQRQIFVFRRFRLFGFSLVEQAKKSDFKKMRLSPMPGMLHLVFKSGRRLTLIRLVNAQETQGELFVIWSLPRV